jgi:mono/diheme cytochrome c family protein
MSDFNNYIKDKIKDLKNNKGSLFGLTYPYILLIGLALGLIYISKLGEIARQTVPLPLPDTSAIEHLKIVEPRTVGAVNVMELSKTTNDLIAKGKALYEANCASCHGVDGKGDGPASQGLNPPPRNYTIKKGWVNGQKLSQIYETLENGILATAMKSYDYLAPEDKFALAHYIRNTFVADPPQDSQSDLQNLEQTYNLSKERRIPGQIPISAAMDLIIKENTDKVTRLKEAIKKISNDNSDGAAIFKKVTKDQEAALTSLINSSDWKKDKSKFVNLIVNNINQDGFNDKIFFLNDSQWNIFYNYMNNII